MNQQMKMACCAVGLSASLAAFAQTAVKAPSSQLPYASAFADYKPWQDRPAGDWRDLNDTIGASAGMDMSMPMPPEEVASAAQPATSTMPAMKHHGHHGHAGHGGNP